MKRILFLFVAATALLGLVSCSSEDITEGELKEVTFRVMNIYQEDMSDGTRAESADVLAHLSLGVFDAGSGQPVRATLIQNRGDEGYGTFRLALPTGTYRLVFLGYDGSKALRMSSPTDIRFEDDYVPHTFLYATELRVDEEVASSQTVTLRRAVAAVRLLTEDAWPQGLSTFRLETTGGSTQLNGLTGLASGTTGRKANVQVPESMWGGERQHVTFYFYLPAASQTMDVTFSALDAKGQVMQQRTFRGVETAINKLTVFRGSFFSIESQAAVEVDYEWGEETEQRF